MSTLAALGPIAAQLEALNEAVAMWDTRDDSVAQIGVRKAGSDAVLAVDDLLRGLYELRAELREDDAATAARTDELLARVKARHQR